MQSCHLQWHLRHCQRQLVASMQHSGGQTSNVAPQPCLMHCMLPHGVASMDALHDGNTSTLQQSQWQRRSSGSRPHSSPAPSRQRQAAHLRCSPSGAHTRATRRGLQHHLTSNSPQLITAATTLVLHITATEATSADPLMRMGTPGRYRSCMPTAMHSASAAQAAAWALRKLLRVR